MIYVHHTSRIKWTTDTSKYFYIDLSSVDRDTHNITETLTINAENAPSRAQQIVFEKDVLFATTRPTLKRFCIIDSKYDKQICSTGFCVLRAKESIVLPRWLFYMVSSSAFYDYVEVNQKGASYPAISDKEVKLFKIPVPPIEVQSDIVRILDNFTELTAELTARKKQYEYYRDKLLTFGNEIQTAKLGDYFPEIRNGFVGTATPYFTTEDEGVRYLKGTNIHDGIISDNDFCYITPEFHQKHIRNELKVNDVLMVQSGHVGECAVVDEKYAGSNCHALIIMSNGGNCNSKYVVHYLYSVEGKKKLARITTGGTVKHILASEMKKLTIPMVRSKPQEQISIH